MSVARITTAEMKELHKDYKPDRIDKYILVSFRWSISGHILYELATMSSYLISYSFG